MDTTHIRELLDKRDEIDAQIREAVAVEQKRKPQKCGICGQEGHSQRTCPQKKPE